MKILDIIRENDELLLFFEEGTDLHAIVDEEKIKYEEDIEQELWWYEQGVTTYKFLWKEYPVIFLWFDYEEEKAKETMKCLLAKYK